MNKYKTVFALLLLVTYDYLFWSQSLGLNTLLFTLIAIPVLIATNKFSIAYLNVWITAGGTLLSALLVLLYNSGTSKVAYLISFTLMVGFIHQPSLRTAYHSLLTALYDFFGFHKNFLAEYEKYKSGNKRVGKALAYLGLSFIPLIVVTVFYWIFKLANPVFDELSSRVWNNFWFYVGEFFTGFSFSRFFFLLIGLAVCSLLLFNRRINFFVLRESNQVTNTGELKMATLFQKEVLVTCTKL